MSVLFTRRRNSNTFPVLLSNLEIGSSIFLNVGGARTEFLVIHHGNPDTSIYDASCDGVWIMNKKVVNNVAWNSATNNNVAPLTSGHYIYGMVDFFTSVDSYVQKIAKTVKIPYISWEKDSSGEYNFTLRTLSNGAYAKAFPLSCYEVGYTKSIDSYVIKDGSVLSYFADNSNEKRIAYNDSDEASRWWTRSPYTENNKCGSSVSYDGSYSYVQTLGSAYGRYAMILPHDVLIDYETHDIVGRLVSSESVNYINGVQFRNYSDVDNFYMKIPYIPTSKTKIVLDAVFSSDSGYVLSSNSFKVYHESSGSWSLTGATISNNASNTYDIICTTDASTTPILINANSGNSNVGINDLIIRSLAIYENNKLVHHYRSALDSYGVPCLFESVGLDYYYPINRYGAAFIVV